MALKTVETKKSVTSFVDSIKDETKNRDVKALIVLVSKITGKQPALWGTIIGFGKYIYCRKNSKEELQWFNVGIAPRKDNITIYVTVYLENEPLVKRLGKCKIGKGCIYIKNLNDIKIDVLAELITKYKDHKWSY